MNEGRLARDMRQLQSLAAEQVEKKAYTSLRFSSRPTAAAACLRCCSQPQLALGREDIAEQSDVSDDDVQCETTADNTLPRRTGGRGARVNVCH